jgi:asparagine synthase (glutamine-hydrolysing)
MCGISGKIYLKPVGIVTQSDLNALADKISHRGPDDLGFYISDDKRVGFAHNRLSIIDLSSRGHQPMNYLKKYWIVFNGEIYNFTELKNNLLRSGYKFHSKTDTEVILALYDKYGTACLQKMRGMFAFAVFDIQKNQIFIARDRLGKKPLKYFTDGKVFYFASELKAFLSQPELKKELDLKSINSYLTFGYVPHEDTGFLNIRKLSPGSFLILNLNSGKVQKESYWSLDFSKKLDLTEDAWCELIRKEFDEAVKLRLVGDVPIGVFLSGGVDSSAVVASMAKFSTKPIRTFTISFDEASHDESRYAQLISQRYHTDHTVLPAESGSMDLLPTLAAHFEEPFADNSSVITYMVCKMARDHVKVVLNGDGGDENFAGYPRYRRIARDVFMDRFRPAYPFIDAVAGLGQKTPLRPLSGRIQRFLKKSSLGLGSRFASYNCYFTNADLKRILKKSLGRDTYELVEKEFAETDFKDPRDNALAFDFRYYIPDDLMAKMDMASMSVGLEARSPFLDHRFVELAAQIPFSLKLKNFSIPKYILKKALEPLVPHENLYRPKVGFSSPLSVWFSGRMAPFAASTLLSKTALINEFIDHREVKNMFESNKHKDDFGMQLWNLLQLELWLQAFFK